MLCSKEDQAAGLRRLFRQSPPAVASVYVSGHQAEASVLRLAHRLAGASQSVLVLDEAPEERSEPLDLLHALDGRVSLGALRRSLGGGVFRVPVATAAPAFALLDAERRQRLLGLMEELHRRAGFVLVRSASARRPSPFAWAAPRSLLLAEASGRGATEAYALVKDLAAAGAGSLQVAVVGARSRDEAARFFGGLEGLVRRHVGLPLAWLGEVERDDVAASLALPAPNASPREAEWAFMRRLHSWGRGGRGIGGAA
jgi:flagellar biosynthesis protein FlhG